MPSLSQESEDPEGSQDEVVVADSDTLQTKEEQAVHHLEFAEDLLSYQPRETGTQISPIGHIEMSSVKDFEKTEDAKDDEQEFDQEEKGNFLKNFLEKNKNEVKMVYNFHDGQQNSS
jgi:hypothetical protein